MGSDTQYPIFPARFTKTVSPSCGCQAELQHRGGSGALAHQFPAALGAAACLSPLFPAVNTQRLLDLQYVQVKGQARPPAWPL